MPRTIVIAVIVLLVVVCIILVWPSGADHTHGEDYYYERLTATEPGFRPYQHIWLQYEQDQSFVDFREITDSIQVYLRQFLIECMHGDGTDLLLLDAEQCSNDVYIRSLSLTMLGIAINDHTRRVDLLVNHRNIGGSALLELIRYGLGGPDAITDHPIPAASCFTTIASYIYSLTVLTRTLVFKHANLVRSQVRRFAYRRAWYGTTNTIRTIADEVCLAAGRDRLVCWCPVVFEKTTKRYINDIGVIVFVYDKGMSHAALRTRLRKARRMVHGARTMAAGGGTYFTRALRYHAGMYCKARVDLVISMAHVHGTNNKSAQGLRQFYGSFHSTMFTRDNYPYYAYAATIGSTTHTTITVADTGFQSDYPTYWKEELM